jgi:hypothetical protein
MSLNIPILDEHGCLKDVDKSFAFCASATESLESSYCIEIDCSNLYVSLDALTYSYDMMSKELCSVNLDTERIMDELVKVNAEIERLKLDNKMKRKELLFAKQSKVLDVNSLDCSSYDTFPAKKMWILFSLWRPRKFSC